MKILIRIIFVGILITAIGWMYGGGLCLNAEMVTADKIIYPTDKAILLKLNITDNKLSLLKSEIVAGPGPNYLPGEYKFVAKVFSVDGKILGEYGFGDPRIILGEQGYQGPTWLDNVDFTLIIPYFDNAKTVNIYSDNILILSADILKEASNK